MKKLHCLILSFLCVFSLIGANPIMAQEQPANEGTCGASAYWEYNAETKALTVSGNGTVTELKGFDKQSEVEKLVVQSGIETIGYMSFSGYNFRRLYLRKA